MKMIYIVDDGTLDIVFRCSHCGQTIRYADVDRSDDGGVTEYFFQMVKADHMEDCSNNNQN